MSGEELSLRSSAWQEEGHRRCRHGRGSGRLLIVILAQLMLLLSSSAMPFLCANAAFATAFEEQHREQHSTTTSTSTPSSSNTAFYRNSQQPLRLCLLVEPSPITYVCGISGRFQALVQYLAHHSHDDVQLITVEAVHPRPPRVWRVAGYKDATVPVHYTCGVPFPLYPLMSVSCDVTFQVLRRAIAWRPTLMHVSSPGWLVLTTTMVARLLQVPLVISYHTHLPAYVHSYVPPCLRGLALWCLWRLLALVHNQADLTLVTSVPIQHEFAQRGIGRTVVWPKGIDTHTFHPRHESVAMRFRMSDGHPHQHLLVSIGRLAEEKRLKGLKTVLERLPNVRMCFVGTGPQEVDLRDYFAGTPTTFLGQLTGNALSQAFASADVFVMPSDSETLGFVVLESMASGVPVIGARAGGVPDLIEHDQTGLLYEAGNVDELTSCVQALLHDEPRRRHMARAAHQAVQEWTWDASMHKLRHEYYGVALHNFEQRWLQRLWRFVTSRKSKYS